MSKFIHTEDTDARIRRGYETGEHTSFIAAALGLTNFAVLGRARRIGLFRADCSKIPHQIVSADGKERQIAAIRRLWKDPAHIEKMRDSGRRLYAEGRAFK